MTVKLPSHPVVLTRVVVLTANLIIPRWSVLQGMLTVPPPTFPSPPPCSPPFLTPQIHILLISMQRQ